jgi:hypothetical protein
MAAPATYNISIYRGDTYRWQFVLWNDIGKTDPTDLTDVTPKAQIRDKPTGTVITTLDCTVTLPNIIDAVLTATNSALLKKAAVWDLQLTYGTSGDVATVLAGGVAVTLDVTDSDL